MQTRTSITISEVSRKKAEEIKKALPFLKSFGAVVEYCIARVHEEVVNQKIQGSCGGNVNTLKEIRKTDPFLNITTEDRIVWMLEDGEINGRFGSLQRQDERGRGERYPTGDAGHPLHG